MPYMRVAVCNAFAIKPTGGHAQPIVDLLPILDDCVYMASDSRSGSFELKCAHFVRHPLGIYICMYANCQYTIPTRLSRNWGDFMISRLLNDFDPSGSDVNQDCN